MKGIDEDPRSPQALKDIVNAALDVFDQTVREGRVEGGVAVVLARRRRHLSAESAWRTGQPWLPPSRS